MAWYNRKSAEIAELQTQILNLESRLDEEEKSNPAQPYNDTRAGSSREPNFQYEQAYEKLEIVNRSINMIVDDTSQIPFSVGSQLEGTAKINTTKGIKAVTLHRLLNIEPNPFQDISSFRRNLVLDLMIDGNAFIYWDGRYLYHLAARKVNVVQSKEVSKYIDHYEFEGTNIKYSPNEIIHIKDNSFYSIYRGVPRLKPAYRTMQLMLSMRSFQDNFFKNAAVPGLVIKSPNTLSERIKERMIASWSARYNPQAGGRRPLILDGGTELDTLSDINFKDLDFQNSIADNEKIILKALGVPPVLLDSGNNANLRPNMRLFYLETIIPIIDKFSSAYQRFFGFEIKKDVIDIQALQPELNEQSDYYSSLVNGGIITVNEARERLGFEKIDDTDNDKVRVPANIAGSAVNPSEGGRPEEGEQE